jgi:hypothetical protein
MLSFTARATAVGLRMRRRPDVVIASSPHLLVSLSGLAIARRFRVPYLFEVRDLWPSIASAIGRSDHPPAGSPITLGNDRSFAWQQGSWGCVSARDYTVAPASAYAATGDIAPGDHTVGLPVAGCARSTFPNGARASDGSPALSAALEQVVVYPNVETGTTGVPSTQARALTNRVSALGDALDQYGIGVVALAAMTAQKLDQAPPGGHVLAQANPPSAWPARQGCGGGPAGYWPATSTPSAPWSKNGASGTTWVLATAGGYPCQLAEPVFRVFLANLTSSSSTLSTAQLHRYGWQCTPSRADLISICRFSPELYLERLHDGVGRDAPNSFRVGVAALLPGVQSNRLGTAIDATR